MIDIEIPGIKRFNLKYLVLDFNGTLAVDGRIIGGVKELLSNLSELLEIHVITADTFGCAAKELEGVECTLTILQGNNQTEQKEDFVKHLGADFTVAIGNGANDALMIRSATLGIGLVQSEGLAVKTMVNADILCSSIIDALGIVACNKRLTATLRG